MKKLTLATIFIAGALSLMAADGKALTQKCAGCHGADFGKKALGVSKIVKNMKADEIVKALEGYKAGTFGGPMKGIMKSQISSYNDKQIKVIAKYITGLK